MKTKNIFGILFAGIFLVLALSLVIAANESNESKGGTRQVISDSVGVPDDAALIATNTQKNMTYGLCVAGLTKQKNECAKNAKTTLKTCTNSASKNKGESSKCKKAYKDGTNSCKKTFKDSKTNCKQYKKTFADKLKFWQ